MPSLATESRLSQITVAGACFDAVSAAGMEHGPVHRNLNNQGQRQDRALF